MEQSVPERKPLTFTCQNLKIKYKWNQDNNGSVILYNLNFAINNEWFTEINDIANFLYIKSVCLQDFVDFNKKL